MSFRRPVVRRWPDRVRGSGRWDEKLKTAAKDGEKPNDNGAASSPDKKEDTKEDKKEPRNQPWSRFGTRRHRRHAAPEDQRDHRSPAEYGFAAWHVDTNRFVPLGTDLLERVTPIRRQRLAYAVNWAPYTMDRTIGRPSADVYLIDIETGARTKVKDGIDDQYLQRGPADVISSTSRPIGPGPSTRPRGRRSTSRRRLRRPSSTANQMRR